METEVLMGTTVDELNQQIKMKESKGWHVVGAHQVVTRLVEYIRTGDIYVRQQHHVNYSITMQK